MNRKYILLTVTIALFASIISTAFISTKHKKPKSDDLWVTDFEAAKKAAKKGDKYMLLNFTGSDWCGWCKKLDREVFSTADFKTYAEKELILVKLDFPYSIPQSDELKAQNESLRQKYDIRGYPTILLLDQEGNLIAQTGYRPGGGGAYVEHIEELKSK